MKYGHLIWAMLWQRKLRASLSFLSIVVAFLLFGMLQGIHAAFQQTVERANVDRLIVSNRISVTESLPYRYLREIEVIPGVRRVAHESWFGSYYQDPKNAVAVFPTDAARDFAVHPEYRLPANQLDALERTRTGAVAGRALAKRYGWKIGDTIPLHSTIWVKAADGNSDWTFDLVGLYDDPEDPSSEEGMFVNYQYFDEARSFGNGQVDWYVVQVADPTQSARIAAIIDKRFANSANATRTETEQAYQQAFLEQIGDIGLIVAYILGAVFFALLIAIGSATTQTMVEQIPALAVLKTLGFSDARVLALLLAQSCMLFLIAALFGLAIADILFPKLGGKLGIVAMPPRVVAEGLAIALLLAASNGIVPAWRANRLPVVEALRS